MNFNFKYKFGMLVIIVIALVAPLHASGAVSSNVAIQELSLFELADAESMHAIIRGHGMYFSVSKTHPDVLELTVIAQKIDSHHCENTTHCPPYFRGYVEQDTHHNGTYEKIGPIMDLTLSKAKVVEGIHQWNLKDAAVGIDPTASLRVALETESILPIAFTVHELELPYASLGQVWFALVLLVLLYGAILYDFMPRPIVAMAGAVIGVAMVWMLKGKPPMQLVVAWIDNGSIWLLLGMMIIVGMLSSTGLFEYCALVAFKFSKGNLWRLLVLLCTVCAVLSAFLDNVTTILLMSPVTLRLARVVKVNPIPFLLSEVLFSNIGGTATLVGDPPNIIIGNFFSHEIVFLDFIINLTPGLIICALVTFAMVKYIFRDTFSGKEGHVSRSHVAGARPIAKWNPRWLGVGMRQSPSVMNFSTILAHSVSQLSLSSVQQGLNVEYVDQPIIKGKELGVEVEGEGMPSRPSLVVPGVSMESAVEAYKMHKEQMKAEGGSHSHSASPKTARIGDIGAGRRNTTLGHYSASACPLEAAPVSSYGRALNVMLYGVQRWHDGPTMQRIERTGSDHHLPSLDSKEREREREKKKQMGMGKGSSPMFGNMRSRFSSPDFSMLVGQDRRSMSTLASKGHAPSPRQAMRAADVLLDVSTPPSASSSSTHRPPLGPGRSQSLAIRHSAVPPEEKEKEKAHHRLDPDDLRMQAILSHVDAVVDGSTRGVSSSKKPEGEGEGEGVVSSPPKITVVSASTDGDSEVDREDVVISMRDDVDSPHSMNGRGDSRKSSEQEQEQDQDGAGHAHGHRSNWKSTVSSWLKTIPQTLSQMNLVRNSVSKEQDHGVGVGVGVGEGEEHELQQVSTLPPQPLKPPTSVEEAYGDDGDNGGERTDSESVVSGSGEKKSKSKDKAKSRLSLPVPDWIRSLVSKKGKRVKVEEKEKERVPEAIGSLDSKTVAELEKAFKISDKVLVTKSLIVLGVVVIAFSLQSLHGVEPAWVAMTGATLLLLLAKPHELEPFLNKVEWGTLIFFSALFIFVECLVELGLIRAATSIVAQLIGLAPVSTRLALAIILVIWVSAIVSAFIDNVPWTATMVPVIAELAENEALGLPLRPLIWALSFGACLGGNGTLIGASANIVAVGCAQSCGYDVSFKEFMKVGMPVMLVTTTIATGYAVMMYVGFGLTEL